MSECVQGQFNLCLRFRWPEKRYLSPQKCTFYCLYRLYYSIFKRGYRASSGDAMLENLKEHLKVYNNEQSETCAEIESTADGQTVIALCTPVMKRIRRLERHCGEMLFMDSSGVSGLCF